MQLAPAGRITELPRAHGKEGSHAMQDDARTDECCEAKGLCCIAQENGDGDSRLLVCCHPVVNIDACRCSTKYCNEADGDDRRRSA